MTRVCFFFFYYKIIIGIVNGIIELLMQRTCQTGKEFAKICDHVNTLLDGFCDYIFCIKIYVQPISVMPLSIYRE